MQINRIPEHRCHMTTRSLHRADTAKREGLCQLGDDVMIYFEEVMSGLCSEAWARSTVALLNLTATADAKWQSAAVSAQRNQKKVHGKDRLMMMGG